MNAPCVYSGNQRVRNYHVETPAIRNDVKKYSYSSWEKLILNLGDAVGIIALWLLLYDITGILSPLLIFIGMKILLDFYGFGSRGIIRNTYASNYQRCNPFTRELWFAKLKELGSHLSTQLAYSWFVSIIFWNFVLPYGLLKMIPSVVNNVVILYVSYKLTYMACVNVKRRFYETD
ncbi:uncharacterized protein LOC129229962 [Uloborus diversus]|uniref:uncharacterized protein LOC129229962 n=1 Tax=Uloborus diversus TaxID=327109 RepID=UPI002409BBE4|nr:uncharacterized protein LOC129229962 [Uloborus diversus]